MALTATGTVNAYLDPCGCGGQTAGGLARRAQLLTDLRRDHPGLLTIDLGNFGMMPDRLPVIARSLAAMGTDACGLAAEDLTQYMAFRQACRAAAVPFSSLVPPLDAVPAKDLPPRSMVLTAPGDVRVGLVSIAFGSLTTSQLAEQCATELGRLRSQERCAFGVLITHLGATGSERVVAKLPADRRPLLVLLATDDNEPAPAYQRLDCWWVPVAHKGRSLSLVTVTTDGTGFKVQVDQRLVTDGPRDPVVQGYVDDYYRRQKASETAQQTAVKPSFALVAACVPCHERSVAGWRRHPHARAVETLEKANRDVAACLRCHDERLRRDGVRSPAGADRGVECASCHAGLTEHLADPKRLPARPERALCERCHSPENSPHWSYEAYLRTVAAACRANP